jgi:hypothetical protein
VANDIEATLRDILVARGIANEAEASAYAASLDAVQAKRLVDLIMSGAGGPTQNLSGGEGGFLAGISKLMESRQADSSLALPETPWLVEREAKREDIRAYEAEIHKSNDSFVDGLRLILENKREEQLGSLRVWAVELSDEDFPVRAQDVSTALTESNRQIIDAVKRQLEDQARATGDLVESHRDAADE